MFQKYIFIFLGPHNIQCLRVLIRCPIRRLSHRIDIVPTIPRKHKVFFCSTWLELYEYVIRYSGNIPADLIKNMNYWVLIGNYFGNIYAYDIDYGYLFIASRFIEIWQSNNRYNINGTRVRSSSNPESNSTKLSPIKFSSAYQPVIHFR